MGIGNLGGFNPNNINNLKNVGGNKPNQTNGQNNGDATKGASNETYTPKEVQASALDMLGNLNRGLVGGKIKDLPEARIGGEKDGPTATQMADHSFDRGQVYYRDGNRMRMRSGDELGMNDGETMTCPNQNGVEREFLWKDGHWTELR